jgi:ABC-type polysaccharide/polyol phosphate export permease
VAVIAKHIQQSIQWRLLYSLNPMVGIIDDFRWSILGKSQKFIDLG